jgi:DNA-binding CsgD family transcriptional regulator
MVSLSSPDLRALRAVHDALLDPLSHDTIDEWLLGVCDQFQVLCHGSASMAAVSSPDEPTRFVSRDIPEESLKRMTELSLSPGSLRTSDPRIEGLMEGLRQRSSAVGTTADLLGPGRLQVCDLQNSPMFRDVAFPLGLPGSTLLLHSGASGEFLVHSSYPEIERRPFGEATPQIMAALLPAFAASVGALARLGSARKAIAALIDVLEDGVVVVDSDCRRLLTKNAAMCAMARYEPDIAGLERRILQSVLAAARQPATTKSGPIAPAARALSGGWRSQSGTPYRLRTVRLPAGSLATGEAILVLVQRVGPPVPGPVDLMPRFGFTRREAEVAHRLAYGRSDREIAAELHLSVHTVRHYAEAIFIKVGVTSRKAFALHLAVPVAPES